MSDTPRTPRTDALANRTPSQIGFMNWVGELLVHARQLELEVEELKKGFPDIGPDPLKASGEERKRLHDQTGERLSKASCLQQSGVPDQTALVWRIDLDRQHQELIIAGTKKKGIEQERDRLLQQLEELKKEHDNLVELSVATMCIAEEPRELWEKGMVTCPTIEAVKTLRNERDQFRNQLENIYNADGDYSQLRQQFLDSQLREGKLRDVLKDAKPHRLEWMNEEGFQDYKKRYDEALSTPTDDTLLREVREALEWVLDESEAGDILCKNGLTMSFHKNSPVHKKLKHALQLLGGGKDKE